MIDLLVKGNCVEKLVFPDAQEVWVTPANSLAVELLNPSFCIVCCGLTFALFSFFVSVCVCFFFWFGSRTIRTGQSQVILVDTVSFCSHLFCCSLAVFFLLLFIWVCPPQIRVFRISSSAVKNGKFV